MWVHEKFCLYVLYRYMYYFSLPLQVPASYERSWCQEGPTLALKPSNPPTLKLSHRNPFKPFWSLALWRASHAANHFRQLLVIARIRGHVIADDSERLAKSRGKFGIWPFATIAMHSYCECLLQCTVIVNVHRKTCLWCRIVLQDAALHFNANVTHARVHPEPPVSVQAVLANSVCRLHAPVEKQQGLKPNYRSINDIWANV